MKKPVSQRALMSRINRKLAKQDEVLKKSSPNAKFHSTTGDYYIVNTVSNNIIDTSVHIETLGRECGALADFEELEK